MPVPTKPQPARNNPLDLAPAPIAAELRAQLETRAERRKKAQPGRSKATFDLSEQLQDLVVDMAEAEGITQSAIVALAILRLQADLQAGLDLTPLKRPTKSLKSLYALDLAAASGSLLGRDA